MTLKEQCLERLRLFIDDSTNENKMELFIAYDDIADEDKLATLGDELNEALERILLHNHHPDAYLQQLSVQFFV